MWYVQVSNVYNNLRLQYKLIKYILIASVPLQFHAQHSTSFIKCPFRLRQYKLLQNISPDNEMDEMF